MGDGLAVEYGLDAFFGEGNSRKNGLAPCFWVAEELIGELSFKISGIGWGSTRRFGARREPAIRAC